MEKDNKWNRLYANYIDKEYKDWDEYFKTKMKLKKKFLNQVLKHYDNNKPVLECGCGTGKFSAYLASLGLKTYAIDLEEAMVNQTKDLSNKVSPNNQVNVMQGDIHKIPFARKIACALGISPIGIGVVFASLASGYPTGARLAASLVDDGLISQKEGEDIAAISSFCSPAFIISYIGGTLLGNSLYAIPILISHYLSMLTYILIFTVKNDKYAELKGNITLSQHTPIGKRLFDAVNYGCTSTIAVGGYITLFYVFCNMIKIEALPVVNSIVTVLSEISMGTRTVAGITADLSVKIACLSACVSWGGVCIIMQSTGFMVASGIKCGRFLWTKIMQAFLSGTLAYIICVVFKI